MRKGFHGTGLGNRKITCLSPHQLQTGHVLESLFCLLSRVTVAQGPVPLPTHLEVGLTSLEQSCQPSDLLQTHISGLISDATFLYPGDSWVKNLTSESQLMVRNDG